MKTQAVLLYVLSICLFGCIAPASILQSERPAVPDTYKDQTDTTKVTSTKWKDFFKDPYLVALIDTAIRNNPELPIALQEIEKSQNNILIRKAALYPYTHAGIGLSVDKVGRYTSEGAGDASTEMTPGKPVPDPLSDIYLGFQSSWEADIWGKLHTAKKAAYTRYLSTVEGKNLVQTNLVAEVANAYYELKALDYQLSIIRKAIAIQQNELEVVKVQKEAAMATSLAVKQFEARVYKSQSMEYETLQQINETENDLNRLLGRYNQKIERDTSGFFNKPIPGLQTGIPVDLLKNRPDIRQAELELLAAKCEVNIAKAEFYPSLGLSAGLGVRAFKPSFLFTMPESLLFSLANDIATPVFNRNAIKAEYKNAKAAQIEAIYEYKIKVLSSFAEVSTQLSSIKNLELFFQTKSSQADALNQAVDISSELFRSAKADYLEVLYAQQEALEAQLELVETRKRQYLATINLYKALGGGWQ